MEGSESESIFDTLNLNPQLFINEAINNVDDLVEEAFDFYKQQALNLLKLRDTDRENDLAKGIAHIQDIIQITLDKRLGLWENYCLRQCFAVPKGFTLPKPNKTAENCLIDQDAFSDPELEAELESLRDQITLVEKESAKLNQELQALEKQHVKSSNFSGSINEALQLYEQNSMHEMFQEMVGHAAELREKMENLNNSRREEVERTRLEKIYNPNIDWSQMKQSNGKDCSKQNWQTFKILYHI